MINLQMDSLQPTDFQTQESYKMIRTNIQFCGVDKKVIVFTSSVANEGKSNISFNVAVSFAQTGKRVLYIDADLRKSVFQVRTQVTQPILGLSHFLAGQATLEDVTQTVNIPNLTVIFAGPKPPNPAELLGHARFEGMIKAARKAFDYIIIDSPPVGTVIDSAILARNCDGFIFVIASEKISYKFAQQTKKQIEKTDCPILGVVLSKVNIKSSRYKNGYYSSYYGE